MDFVFLNKKLVYNNVMMIVDYNLDISEIVGIELFHD